MKDFIDRMPTKAGRRKLTFDDGEVKYATVEMADEPLEEGTPLNRRAFMEFQGFQNENTVIEKENSAVTRITSTNADEEVSEAVVTKTGGGYVIEEAFTGVSGLTTSKTTRIVKIGNSYHFESEVH